MSPLNLSLLALGAVVIGLILWLVSVYNGLVTLRLRAQEAWSDIDVQLKRRYDLIPNLIETVKGYAKHESETFDRVVQARANAMHAQTIGERSAAENELSQTLKSIIAIAEAYPDLKASQNFLQLQDDLKDTEDKIQAARRFYNANVRDFNTKIEVFPNNIVAARMDFKKFDFFQIAEGERGPVQVKF